MKAFLLGASAYLSLSFVVLFVCLFVCLFVGWVVCLFVGLFVCWVVCLLVCLFFGGRLACSFKRKTPVPRMLCPRG